MDTTAPRRIFSLKLRVDETAGSIMMFEETMPAGTKSTFHLHHDSDELAYVLAGEITFWIAGRVSVGRAGDVCFMPRGVAHAWKSTGAEPGRLLFVYTPGRPAA
jgi:quercetin dioxygenase-like cupin family protein